MTSTCTSKTLFFIYGPPGSGKTTLGKSLAEALGLPFLDLDGAIQARAGQTIPEIFQTQGETGFRAVERACLEEAAQRGQGVVALGGGALLDPACRELAESCGDVLCLSAPPEALAARLEQEAGVRPLLGGEQGWQERLSALLERRSAHYASFPLQLDTGSLGPEEAAREAEVRLGAFRVSGMGAAYDVRVVSGGLEGLGEMLRQRGLNGPLVLAADGYLVSTDAPRALDSLQRAGYVTRLAAIPPGEEHKTVATVGKLWEEFLVAGLERGSTVIAMGGGVTTDLAGFAAATYLRGVRWVALPTSLLGMADASLGGKTGADLPQGKNLVGAFHPPSLVLADPQLLSTLPEPELRSGMAEVVKHGILADRQLFARCAQGWQAATADLDEIVRRGMAVKIGFIQSDPYEKGLRAALNLGHTVGHAVELASGFRLRHGEAVAIGLAVEARLAEDAGIADAGLAETILACLHGLGLPTAIPAWIDGAVFLKALRVDKKNAAGKVRFALPVRLGEYKIGVSLDFDFASLLPEAA
jgi:3-dehydroquinate synthase